MSTCLLPLSHGNVGVEIADMHITNSVSLTAFDTQGLTHYWPRFGETDGRELTQIEGVSIGSHDADPLHRWLRRQNGASGSPRRFRQREPYGRGASAPRLCFAEGKYRCEREAQ